MVAERVDVPVLQDVEHGIDMLVPSDGRWTSDTGGDVEYNEKSTASVPSQLMKRDLLSISHKYAVGSRRAVRRVITSVKQKERIKAYEQQAADARECAIMLEAELQRIYAGILALMDENLIPSASTGEPKALYFELKDDYYRSLAERATGDARSKAVDVPMVSERQAPMIQKVLKTVEVPQMQYSHRIVDSLVVTQCRVSTIQLVQKTVEMP